jgi:hypothetical protein
MEADEERQALHRSAETLKAAARTQDGGVRHG